MILRLPHTRALAIPLVAAAVLGGCGGSNDEKLAEGTAQKLLRELDQVDRRVALGECSAVRRGSLVRLERNVESLPGDSADVRAALEDGIARLRDLVDAQCEEEPVETQTETVPTETVPPPPTQTETEPQTQTETEPQTQTTPPDEDETEQGTGPGGQEAPPGFPPGQRGRNGGAGDTE